MIACSLQVKCHTFFFDRQKKAVCRCWCRSSIGSKESIGYRHDSRTSVIPQVWVWRVFLPINKGEECRSSHNWTRDLSQYVVK